MAHFLVNMEKAAERCEKWLEEVSPGVVGAMRQYAQQMRSGKAQKASA